MHLLRKFFMCLLFFNPLIATAHNAMEELYKVYHTRLAMSFGDHDKEVEFYYFTSWNCDECQKTDLLIKDLSSEILQNSKLYFLTIVGKENKIIDQINATLLSNPNKQFKIYFESFTKLKNLNNEKLTEKEIIEKFQTDDKNFILASNDVTQLNLSTTELIRKNLNIDTTPCVVIYDLESRQKKVLKGSEINKVSLEQNLKILEKKDSNKEDL